MTEIAQKLMAFLVDTLGITVEGSDTQLISQGLIDSMQVVELALFLEGEADVALDETDMVIENFDTVDAMVALCRAKA